MGVEPYGRTVLHREREPAEDGRARVVRMALHASRDVEDADGVARQLKAEQARPQEHARDRGGRGRAEAPLEGIRLTLCSPKGGRVRAASCATKAIERLTMSVPSVGSSSAPSPSQVIPGGLRVQRHLVHEIQREPEAVESRQPRLAEVAGTLATRRI